MHLARFPRLRLAHLPTPLERLDRLSQALNGTKIWIKRDDCTGLSTGGNKTRKLEFLMAEAQAQGADMVMTQGADMVMTQGATQSNHVRQTVAFETKLGMDCHVLLEDRTASTELNYNYNENVFLDQLHGATIEKRGPGLDMNVEMEIVAKKLAAVGRKVYTRPGGGSNATGALGYVDCAFELLSQANERGLVIDHIVHETGSARTQAGLIAGLKAMNVNIPVLGIGVRAQQEKQEESVYNLAVATVKNWVVPGWSLGLMSLPIATMWGKATVSQRQRGLKRLPCLHVWKRLFLTQFIPAKGLRV